MKTFPHIISPEDTQAADGNHPTDVPVLNVGASIVGLASALFLNWHSIRTLNVERHAGTVIHSRAGHFHLRTLELLRQVGMEPAVLAASIDLFGTGGGINAVESLVGHEIAHCIADLNASVEMISPSRRLFLSQQHLEPLLRARAEELDAELRYGTELVSVTQDENGMLAVIRDLGTGQQRTVRAAHMIAADGNRSPIRHSLGIDRTGPGHLSDCRPPTHCFGGNTGMHDAHNLASKLAMSIKDEAGVALLDTYASERRPIEAWTVGQPTRAGSAGSIPSLAEAASPVIEDLTMEIGYRYAGLAIHPDPAATGLVADPAVLLASPGVRAPHIPLLRDGRPLFTLVLFGKGFVLLAGPDGAASGEAAREASGMLRLRIEVHYLSTPRPPHRTQSTLFDRLRRAPKRRGPDPPRWHLGLALSLNHDAGRECAELHDSGCSGSAWRTSEAHHKKGEQGLA